MHDWIIQPNQRKLRTETISEKKKFFLLGLSWVYILFRNPYIEETQAFLPKIAFVGSVIKGQSRSPFQLNSRGPRSLIMQVHFDLLV